MDKDFQHINPVIEAALAQLERQMKQLQSPTQQMSVEDFESLFKIRARQTLLDHKSKSKFVVDEFNRPLVDLFYSYAMRTNQDKINSLAGIVLNGAYGCGKSVMISAFCRVLNDLKFFGKEEVTEIHAVELADQIRLNGIIPFSKKPLCIQDMGKEPNIVNAFGTVVNPLSNLLAIRAEYGALTYGSTNMTPEMLEEQYHEFIAKRFDEHVNRVFLAGTSRRPDYSRNQPT